MTRITVVGAGAIGTWLAVRLPATQVIVRREKPAEFRLNDEVARPKVVTWDEVRDLRGIVFVAVKTVDLEETLARLAPHRDALIVLCQNGILGALPGENYVRACCWIGVAREAPGVAKVAGFDRFDLAGPRAGEVPLPNAKIVESVALCEWKKALWNVSVNGPCALVGARNGLVLESPPLRRVVERLLDEAMAVAAAEGVKLDDADRADVCRTIGITAANFNATFQDLRAGRRTEIPWLNGAVARIGRRHGIATPYNDLVVDLIAHREDECRKTSR